jgi:hypothetical protein
MLYGLLDSIFKCIIIADVVERRFPVEFRNCIIETSFYLIYYYSNFEIFLSKTNCKLKKMIEENPTLSKIKCNFDLLTKPGTLTMYECVKDGKICDIHSDNEVFDFILFSRLSDSNIVMQKKIVYDINEIATLTEESVIKFILLELKIGVTIYKIDLKTDDFNYYLVGNKFTKQFFIFYLKHYLKAIEEIKDDEKIQLKIIDHDVNSIELDFTDKNESILIEKNGYKISNKND